MVLIMINTILTLKHKKTVDVYQQFLV